jgi:protein involved in sex pheromone biosynthesis
MEKMLTTTKGRARQKSTEQTDKGVGIAMAMQGATKWPQGMKGEKGKETKIENTKTKAAAEEISRNILIRRQRICYMDHAASTMHT